MAKVTKRSWINQNGEKTTTWIIDYVDYNGVRRKKSGFKTRVEADEELTKIKSQVANGTYSHDKRNLNFDEAAKTFIDLHAKLHCKPSTVDSYISCLEMHLIPTFGRVKIVEITPNGINKFIKAKLDEGKSRKTINNCITLLGSVIQRVIDDGLVIQNPAYKVKRLSVQQKEMRFLTNDEIKVVLEIAKRDYEDFYPLLLTAIYTGMRRGELLGLTWDCVNFVTKEIRVKQNLYHGKLITPKSAKSLRRIQITSELAKVLKEWKIKCPPGDKNLVFPNSEGNFLDGDNMNKRRFEPVIRKAKIEHVRFHDLRHTFASLLISSNKVSIKYIQAQMGHSSIQVTMDRYGHIMPEVYQQGRETLSELMQEVMSPKNATEISSSKEDLK